MSTRDPICGMRVDEGASFKLQEGAQAVYFCSRHCLEQYAAMRSIPIEGREVSPARGCAFWLNKNVLIGLVLSGLAVLAYYGHALGPFSGTVWRYVRGIWWAVLLGYLLGGLLDRFVPREYVSKILAKPNKRSVLLAVLLGFLMSACSHGILALSVELHKKGASNPVVVSFLLASPWANLPITLMMIGFFGIKALYIILGALVIALTTGICFQCLEAKGMIETNPNTLAVEPDYSIRRDIRERWRRASWTWANFKAHGRQVWKAAGALADMTLGWIALGIGLSAFAAAFVPACIFQKYLGASWLGLLATLGLASVMEVCSEGTAPLAFEIFKQTGAFGNAFVFLMAGVVTDYTEIAVVWSNIGKKTALWIPAIAVPQVVLLGLVANLLFR